MPRSAHDSVAPSRRYSYFFLSVVDAERDFPFFSAFSSVFCTAAADSLAASVATFSSAFALAAARMLC